MAGLRPFASRSPPTFATDPLTGQSHLSSQLDGVSEMCSERPTRAGPARLIDNAGLGVRPGGT